MLEIYFKTLKDEGFKRIEQVRAGCWIYAKEATLEDLQEIATLTTLDINDLRDCLDKYEIPRIERQGDSIIFFTRHPGEEELGLHTELLTIVLTNHYLVAISPYRSKIIETILSLHPALTTISTSKLLLYILLRITQEFTTCIKRLRHSILFHEQAGFIDSNAIMVLTKNEDILNQYLTALVPMRNLLETLSTERYLHFYKKDLDLLQDLMIAIHQSEDLCRVNVKSIRSSRDSYQILFTNDVNKTIKRLTAITILFSIPTMIASIYGMNVVIPLQKELYAFPLVLGFAFFACGIAIYVFIKHRWL
jgi:magnesium transporter